MSSNSKRPISTTPGYILDRSVCESYGGIVKQSLALILRYLFSPHQVQKWQLKIRAQETIICAAIHRDRGPHLPSLKDLKQEPSHYLYDFVGWLWRQFRAWTTSFCDRNYILNSTSPCYQNPSYWNLKNYPKWPMYSPDKMWKSAGLSWSW